MIYCLSPISFSHPAHDWLALLSNRWRSVLKITAQLRCAACNECKEQRVNDDVCLTMKDLKLIEGKVFSGTARQNESELLSVMNKLPWTVLFESPWTMLFESPWTTRKGDRHPKHQTDAMIAWKAINSTSSPSSRLQGASAFNTRSKARGYSLRNRNNSTICLFGVARQKNSANEFRKRIPHRT